MEGLLSTGPTPSSLFISLVIFAHFWRGEGGSKKRYRFGDFCTLSEGGWGVHVSCVTCHMSHVTPVPVFAQHRSPDLTWKGGKREGGERLTD